MAKRISEEDQGALARPRKEVLADLSSAHPGGLAVLGEEPPGERDDIMVTGGGDPLDAQKKNMGRWWKCVVHDLKIPKHSNPLPVRVSSGAGHFYQIIRTNRVAILPDLAIKSLIEGSTVKSVIRVRRNSPLYGKDNLALEKNEGCEVEWRGREMFLVKNRPRFAIERRELLAGPPAGPVD